MKMVNNQFYKIVRSVVGASNQPIGLHEPSFGQDDETCVLKTVRSGWVSYQGEMVKQFEQTLASYLEAPNVISVVNGTTALFVVLKALNIGVNDEVLVPSLTFAATVNAVCHAGAIPHFVDSCELTFAIDFDKLEIYLHANTFLDDNGSLINKKTGNQIKAIVPVHILGASFDIPRLKEIAFKFNLQIIEDAAEALGSKYKDKRVSALTGLGILSFNGNKIITTGGGGAIVLHDDLLAQKLRHLTTTAKKPHKYEFEHDEIGYNLRMPALNAALGYSQMNKINVFLEKKRVLYNNYESAFNNCGFGNMFNPDLFGESNCWLNAFILDKESKPQKNHILDFLNDQGVSARPMWKPLHLLDIYRDYPRADCMVANDLYERVICLPSSARLANNA